MTNADIVRNPLATRSLSRRQIATTNYRFLPCRIVGQESYKKEFVMKRFWHTCMAVVASASIAGTASAQSDWNQPQEIGSYQSILARAGYAQGATASPTVPGHMANSIQGVAQPAAPMMGQPVQGCQSGNCGTAVNYAPMQSGAVSYAPMQSDCGSGNCGGGCASGNCGGGYIDGGYVDSGYVGGGCASGNCGGDVYGATGGMGGRIGGGGLGGRLGGAVGGGSNSNVVFGARGLMMRRDHEDDVFLTRNGAGDQLLSTDADMRTMGGLDLSLTKRNCEINGPGLDTYLTGLSDLQVSGFVGNLQDYYNGSDTNRVTRENEIHNFEINLLRNGGTYRTRSGRNATYELLGGFRWFQFNEDLRYASFYTAQNPDAVNYDIYVDNTLLGFQLGGRSEICMTDRLSLSLGTKVGLFNNRIEHRQNFTDSNGNFAYQTALGADDYNYSSQKDDLSLLGEIDLGMIFRLSSSSRAVFGYRAVGVSGIALAPNQIPQDFTLPVQINDVNSNGNLILGGGYAGLEFCF
jgi:hypothetical protein